MNPFVTFIAATYNVESKIGRCLRSLDDLRDRYSGFDVVFVDDCSTDGTTDLLDRFAADRPWVSVTVLPVNSGGPSRPRNRGLDSARGDYVYFFDPDDELLVDGVVDQIDMAASSDYDLVRSPLVRDDGRVRKTMNGVRGWLLDASRKRKIERIVGEQSSTVCGLIKRKMLQDAGIQWPEDLRLGEDTVFLASVLSVAEEIGYSDTPDFVYHTAVSGDTRSSTHQYEDRELVNHLTAWDRVQSVLSPVGVDYLALRGKVALQTAYLALVHYNRYGISRDNFEALSSFADKYRETVGNYMFGERLMQIHRAVMNGDYFGFLDAIKLRLVVAGYDLKFIRPAFEALERYYNVAVDEWTGHDSHDEQRSQRLLRWADVVHCEWMLGNAVWYSQRIGSHQRLVSRLHLFELTRDFGDKVDRSRLDKVITVSLPTFEDALKRFDFDRGQMSLIPNYVDVPTYAHSDSPSKVFNIAMVGIIPARKGFHRALELLSDLVKVDDRYNLTVYGKTPEEVPWVLAQEYEGEYYRDCERFMDEHGLRSRVRFVGWSDLKAELADKGFVLSVSDFESFHVAPAEAFASGNIAWFLPWRGVEFIYPSKYVCDDLAEMFERIVRCRDIGVFERESAEGCDYVRQNFSLERFIDRYGMLLEELW